MKIKRKIISLAIVTTLVATLPGCTNAYKEFYKSGDGVTPELISKRRANPPPQEPLVERVNVKDAEAAMTALSKRGYAAIGTSSFNSGEDVTEVSAIMFGKELGADLVLLLNPAYTGSHTLSMPVTTPTSTTSYTNANATAYGSGGPVTAYGSSTTTTYGTKTDYIPITVNRADYGAAYFIKQKIVFGAGYRELTTDEIQKIQSNKGVAVKFIVDGSPAYDADVLPNDILLKVNEVSVTTPSSLNELLFSKAGETVIFKIFRNGYVIEKSVTLSNIN